MSAGTAAGQAGKPRSIRKQQTATVPPAEDAAILWEHEERFWTGGADSARKMTAQGAVFVFPYPAGILQGSAMWREADVAQRWRLVTMDDRYLLIRHDVAVLAYQVSAERADMPVHEALCTSTYLRDNGQWLRLTHQQTPAA